MSHLLFTVSQHKCSTFFTVIDEIGRDERSRTFIKENRTTRIRVVLGCNALHLFPRTTLAGFTPVLVWLAARLLVSCCQWLVSLCQFGDDVMDSGRKFWAQMPSVNNAS